MSLVSVTQAHIDAGEKGDANACPVALAIREMYPKGGVSVATTDVMLINVSATVCYLLSRRMQAWIRRLDSGRPVSPITFRLKRRGAAC